jgi:hypothetical protein
MSSLPKIEPRNLKRPLTAGQRAKAKLDLAKLERKIEKARTSPYGSADRRGADQAGWRYDWIEELLKKDAELRKANPSVRVGAKQKKHARKRNPSQAAAEAFEEFHGRPSEEVITVTQKVHYHSNLAAIGKLEALKGVTCAGSPFLLEDFGGALLCMNEKKTQLFVRGGNQKVDPADFGADAEHELQTLGYVKVIEYFTTKNHLGKEGGTAVYVHKFSRPYPDLIYDVVNKQLLFAGGSYSMPPEGIDN